MSTRRGGKKKIAQPKQQVLSAAVQQLQFADGDDDAQPAIDSGNKPPASPAVKLAQKALSPVITAARAISAAAAAAVLPAIPEEGTSAGINVLIDDDLPSTPKSAKATAGGLFGAEAQQPGDGLPHNPDQHQDDSLQRLQGGTSSSAHTPMPDDHAGELGTEEQQQEHKQASGLRTAAQQAMRNLLQLLRGSRAHSFGGAQLLAMVLLAVALAVGILMACALISQGSTLKAQAQAIQVQQQQVADQARTLHALRQQLQDTSAQLPALKHTAHATNSSLSQLSLQQAALDATLAALSNLTQHLSRSISHVNASSRHGQLAWQMLAAVAGRSNNNGGLRQHNESSLAGSARGTSVGDLGLFTDGSISASNWLRGVLSAVQEQQAAQQRLLLQQHLAQLPLLDLALADCGAHIIFNTTANLTAMPHAPQMQQQGGGRGSTARRVAAKLLPALFGSTPQAAASMSSHRPASGPGSHQGASSPGGDNNSELSLLHRVVLRPASQLFPTSCVPLAWQGAGPAVIEIQLPQAAHITSISLHVPAAFRVAAAAAQPTAASATSATGPLAGSSSDTWQDTTAPGQVTVVLANSSSCGGAFASCIAGTLHDSADATPATYELPGDATKAASQATAVPRAAHQPTSQLKPSVEAMSREARLDGGSYSSSGRAVIEMGGSGGSGSVLADRVVLVVSDAVGGRGAAPGGPCLARVSVHGRPIDPATFC